MKLFKKAMAAVLAGVMALAMVACTPAVTPKPVDPTSAPEAQLVEALNNYSEAVAFVEKTEAVVFENSLKDEAQKILDAMSNGTAVYNTEGKIESYVLSAKQTTLLDWELDANVRYKKGLTTANIVKEDDVYKFAVADYTMPDENAEAFAKRMYNTLKGKKIGIACEDIGGVTCYVLVVGSAA